MDESASLRSLRSHVRVVPGSLPFRGRPAGGRLSLEQETRVRVLPPESLREVWLVWRNGKRTASRTPGAQGPCGFDSLLQHRAGVVQMADTPPSEGGVCEFESHLPYQLRVSARSPIGRGGRLKPCPVRVRISPRAIRMWGRMQMRKRLGFQPSARVALRVRVPPPLPAFHVDRSPDGQGAAL